MDSITREEDDCLGEAIKIGPGFLELIINGGQKPFKGGMTYEMLITDFYL
jgi:hypothetical protein